MAILATLEFETEDGRKATFTLPQKNALRKAKESMKINNAQPVSTSLYKYKIGTPITIHYGTGRKRIVEAN